jgi:hypothetical protein
VTAVRWLAGGASSHSLTHLLIHSLTHSLTHTHSHTRSFHHLFHQHSVRQDGTVLAVGHKERGDEILTLENHLPVPAKLQCTAGYSIDAALKLSFLNQPRDMGEQTIHGVCVHDWLPLCMCVCVMGWSVLLSISSCPWSPLTHPSPCLHTLRIQGLRLARQSHGGGHAS